MPRGSDCAPLRRTRSGERAVTRPNVEAGVAIRGLLIGLAAALFGVAVWRYCREPHPTRQGLDLLRLVDQNGDGRVDEAEYARVTDGELPMSAVDADGSGQLEPWEVDILIRYVSPLRASMSWVPRAL